MEKIKSSENASGERKFKWAVDSELELNTVAVLQTWRAASTDLQEPLCVRLLYFIISIEIILIKDSTAAVFKFYHQLMSLVRHRSDPVHIRRSPSVECCANRTAPTAAASH